MSPQTSCTAIKKHLEWKRTGITNLGYWPEAIPEGSADALPILPDAAPKTTFHLSTSSKYQQRKNV